MYRKRSPHPIIWMLLLSITLFLMLSYTIAAAKPSGTEISAKAAVLYEPETKSFLFKKNESLRLPMASTTKIMTALVAVENSQLDEKVCIDKNAVGIEGSSAYLTEGEILTVEELLYALLLRSANDAATAIAYHVSDGIDNFAEMMNKRALTLGLTDTHFENPHGLDSDNHYTTAKDLALIAAEALNNETIRKIASTYKYTSGTGDKTRTYVNHNKLLKKYDGAIGLKTGFTKKCGRCLVGAAERCGLEFISVTLDAPDDWNDHTKLFDLGFNTLEKIKLAEIGEYRYTIPIIDGAKKTVILENTEGLEIIINKGDHKTKIFPKCHRFISAPVSTDNILGEVFFTVDNKHVGSIKLYPTEDINKKEEKGFLKKFLN